MLAGRGGLFNLRIFKLMTTINYLIIIKPIEQIHLHSSSQIGSIGCSRCRQNIFEVVVSDISILVFPGIVETHQDIV